MYLYTYEFLISGLTEICFIDSMKYNIFYHKINWIFDRWKFFSLVGILNVLRMIFHKQYHQNKKLLKSVRQLFYIKLISYNKVIYRILHKIGNSNNIYFWFTLYIIRNGILRMKYSISLNIIITNRLSISFNYFHWNKCISYDLRSYTQTVEYNIWFYIYISFHKVLYL